jgi:hypothetical protein
MIGITRTEIDRSQVLRPTTGSAFGMVLQVPYGPLTPTYVNTEGDFLQFFSPAGDPDPDYKDYFEAMILLKQSPLLINRPQGDALYGGVKVDKAATGNVVAAISSGIADPSSYTFPDNDVQFVLIGSNPSADNNSYSIKIQDTTSEVSNTFNIELYYNGVLQDTFNVSLVRTQTDDFGNSVYITEILKDRSDIQAIVNTSSDLTVLPQTNDTAVSLGGGVTITSFADTSYTTAAWDYFKEFSKYYTNYLVDCSCNYTIGKYVDGIAQVNWYQHVFLGAPSTKQTNPNASQTLTAWKTAALGYRNINGALLNLNSDHSSLYANWGEIQDNYNNTTLWISPVSTAAARRAFTNSNIGFSQAAAGLNRNRGVTNDFIRLEQDVQTIVDDLEEKQINVLTYTPGGLCIWDERTLQTRYSNTSFQSHRILFNTLEENIEALLLTFAFTDNNEDTRAELKGIVDSYILPLIGTHVEDIESKCDAENNPAWLRNLRQMKLQVACIPYPKANRILFEFIHTRSGVSLTEVF